ncbi:ORF6C domain-containing protein [Enterococcus cecorum]|nr:ORF6C domain-containing protein [Enterococcus cecorum]CAI3502735.1 ORF6C domain-containing protein [Enterococcus cecorum]
MNELKNIGKQHIGEYEFTGIEGGFGEGKKAMLVKDIAEIHGRPVFKVNELINRNIKRFKDGIDVIDLKENNFAIFLKDSGFNQAQINASKNIYLLSERGYSKLLKILEDDKAWEVYEELVDNYFNMRSEQKRLPNTREAIQQLLLQGVEEVNQRVDVMEERLSNVEENAKLDTGDYNVISKRVKKRVYEVARAYGLNVKQSKLLSPLFKDINGGIKRIANVDARTQLCKKHYQSVMDFINDWEPATATRYEIKQMKLDI